MAVIKMNFLSRALGMQTNVTICLPSFSFADIMNGREDVYVPGMKYQVLWLLHGGSGDDSDYVNFSNIVRYADDNKIAVVMPCDFNAAYDDQERTKYRTFVAEELPQMCRAMFPFSDKPEDNFIGGLSMGGQGTIKILCDHPENYAAALIMSSSIGWGDKLPNFGNGMTMDGTLYLGLREKLLKAREEGKPIPKLFLTVGDKDHAYEPMKSHRDWLQENGFDPFFEEVPGYAHEWDFWDLSLRKALKEWLPIRHSVIYPDEA